MLTATKKTIRIQYFAILREQRGCTEEAIQTGLTTPEELYKHLQMLYRFTLPVELLRVSVNNRFVEMTSTLTEGDTVVFISPVAGG